MAKLLLLIKQEDPSINKFEDILNPRMFNKIVDAINKMGKYNEATRNYEKPTSPTEILLRYREKTGINAGNPYLFALPPSIKTQDLQVGIVHRHLSATTLLRKYSKACGAKNHSLLRATTLRKHVATKSMTLNLSSDEIHFLQGYLGHAEKIHREYYRQPIVEREILNISKVLLAAQSTSPSSSSVAGPSVIEREITSGSTASYPMTPTTRAPIASFSRTTPIRSGVAGPSVTELEITSESTESLSRSTPIRNGIVCQSVTELENTSRSTASYTMTPTARTTTASFSRTPIPGTSSTVSPIICTAANCRRIPQVPTTPMSTIPSDDDSDSVYYPSDKSDCELEVLATPKHRRRRIIACSPGQASKKRTWSTPERHAVLHIFSHHIANGTYPSIAEVIEATKGCDELKFRTIPQIKLSVSKLQDKKN
ncbi:hypothetical protein JTB14_022219 [Gonioctena quinquepunctata]|nr:hypothetical protein JTB14_022219 [Gonioctena quinquepunctata]